MEGRGVTKPHRAATLSLLCMCIAMYDVAVVGDTGYLYSCNTVFTNATVWRLYTSFSQMKHWKKMPLPAGARYYQ